MLTATDDLDTLRHRVAALSARLSVLEDRTAIGDLIDRFSRDLDEFTAAGRPFDVGWVRRYFAEDARVAYPPGSAVGAGPIAELIDGRGMAPFRRTHHVTTNYVVDLDGDRAGVRVNLIATHVLDDPPEARFTVGDYYDGELARTDEGWRFTHQALHVTWTDGPPPGSGTGGDRG